MSDFINPPSTGTDQTIPALIGSFQSMVQANAAAQQHMADKQAETEAHRIDLEHKRLELEAVAHGAAMRMDFTMKLLAVALLAGVVVAGFWTGSMTVVTHALTLVAGGLAGFGLARKPR